MKGRFKSPIWVIPVLAMVVALGAFAVMAGINQFSAQPAEANIQEPGQGLTSSVNTEKLSEPFQTPLTAATQEVSGLTVTNNPVRPGSPANYTIRFIASNPLNVGDDITILFESDFQVPTTVDRNQVSLVAAVVTGGAGFEERAPTEVSVELIGGSGDEPEVRLRVPDMDTSDAAPGGQGIGPGEVTIIFRQAAGIRNPAEGHPGRDVTVMTTTDPDPVTAEVPVPWTVELSNDNRSRNQSLTVTGYGFRGQTVFWRDSDADGEREQTEAGPTGVCSTTATNEFVATCTFTVNNPPFAPTHFADGGNCILATAEGCNYINAIDSRGNTTDLSLFSNPQARLDNSTLELRGSVTLQPNAGRAGDTITAQLRDFPNEPLEMFNIAGVPVFQDDDGLDDCCPGGTTPVNGSANFSFEIPSGVPQGVQELQAATDTSATRRANITIGGASLNLSHEQVIPNQDLTISGSGFTQGGNHCIVDGGITLADVPLKIDDSDTCPNDVSEDHGIRLSSGGTFTLTVRVHNLDNIIPVALATPGTHEMRVRDTNNVQGSLTVTIPERTLEVTPASARPRDVVTIIGRGFLADNPDGLSSRVEVTYQCGNDDRQVSTDPDASGNFRNTLRIPTGCAIPSTNTIRAELQAGGNLVDTDTVTHEIPDALVRIEPVRGPSGTQVQVIGEGFRTFEAVDEVRIGGLNAMGARVANTDGQGNFTVADVVVPGLDPGIHSVIVDVGSAPNQVTASTSFEVLETGAEGVPTDVIPGLAEPLGDNLVRVFYFNNTTKVWDFFDPREEFADANTLHELIEGQAVWVRVMEDQTVELNARERNLTCVNPGTPEEDCWNLIVW